MKTQEYQLGASVIILRIGDILSSDAEVVVSSDDDNFTMSGGVSRAILNAGGLVIRTEARAQRATRTLGDMIETSAGTLAFRRIYHVVSRFDGKHDAFDFQTTSVCIGKAVDNCLEALGRSAYSSIAFPAIGTGYAGHAPADVAAAFATAIGKKLVAATKPLRIELFIHPMQLSGDLGFLEFFRTFDNKSKWQAQVIRDHAVAMIHGIRTDARWHDEVGGMLRAADRSINPVPIGYGFLDVFSFLLPIPATRRRLIDKVAADLTVLAETRSTRRLSIIAHSFGTYLTAYALLKSPKVKVHRLILCGSIVPRDFKWDALEERLDVIDTVDYPQARVINDYGWRDVWPVLAQTISFGYGSSGRFGFQTPLVTDRAHDLKHSDFFTPEFVGKFWTPALVEGKTAPNNQKRPAGAWFLQLITRVHIKYVIALGLLVWLVRRSG